MKIEIDIEYIEKFKKELEFAERRACEAEEELRRLNKDEVKKEINQKAYDLADCFLRAVFEKLGFEARSGNILDEYCNVPVEYINDPEKLFDKHIKIEPHVYIVREFKRLYLEIVKLKEM